MTRSIPATVALAATVTVLTLTGCATSSADSAVRDAVTARIDHDAAAGPAAVPAKYRHIDTVEPWGNGYTALVKIDQPGHTVAWEAYGVKQQQGRWSVVDWNTVPDSLIGHDHAACFALVGDDAGAYQACKDQP